MVLGSQFENTFFGENEYRTPTKCVHCNNPIHKDSEGKWVNKSGSPDSMAHRDKPHVPTEQKPLQGMFFDPHTATGSKQDPLISESERRAQVAKSYNLEKTKSIRGVGERKLEAQRTMLEEAGYQSGIPHHVLQNVNTKATIVPRSGRASYRREDMKLFEEVGRPSYETTKKEVSKYKKGAPIPNPKYKDAINKQYFDDDFFGRMDLAAHGTFFDHKGKEIHPDKIGSEEHDIYTEKKIDPKDLPEGHTANIYPGKGKSTDKYIATPFQIETGWRRNSSDYTHTWFHTRHEAIPTGETTTVTERKRIPGKRSINQGTLVHETGHAVDPNIHTRVRDAEIDTVTEAVADGFTDRHHNYKDRTVSELNPSPERAKDFRTTGYTVGHHSVGRTNLNKALYVAVRQHVSMGDNNHMTIPNRETYIDSAPKNKYGIKDDSTTLEHANTMLLGHMYTKHQHVRDILEHTGFTSTGEKAAEYFRKNVSDAGRSAPGYIQGELF